MPAVVGVRLLVRVSGLPPDASLFSLTHFNSRASDIVACPPGEHMCASGGGGVSGGGGIALVGSGRQTLTAAPISVVRPPPPDAVPTAPPIIGPPSPGEPAFPFFLSA